MSTATVRVIIIDDHPLWRSGLSLLFRDKHRFEVVAETGCCRDGLREIQRLAPDLILLDFNLPDMTGLEALLTLREIRPSARVTIVSASGDADIVTAAFENGASGYILKDSSAEEFTRAIESVLAGHFWCSPQIAGTALLHSTQGRSLPQLTQRERTVLFALARGLSNAEIAQFLHLSKYTVQNYISIIYQKLGVSDRWKAADIARRLGAGTPELVWNRSDDLHAPGERNY